MRRATFCSVIAFYAAMGAVWSQTAADFSRADQLPLPSAGVWYRDTTGQETCGGFSPIDRRVVFQSTVGEGARRKLVIVDAETGVDKETIDVDENEAAAREIRRTLESPQESLPQGWGRLSAVARPMGKLPSELAGELRYTFYLRDQETGWLKPLIAEQVRVPGSVRVAGASGNDPVGMGGIWGLGDSGGLLLQFTRLAPSARESGGAIHIYAGPQVVAQFLNEVGFWHYSKGELRRALEIFGQAVETDPGHVKAMYNAACTAALLRDTALSLEYLGMLQSDGSAAALEHLGKVDSDSDFDPIRTRSEFQGGLRSIKDQALQAQEMERRGFVLVAGGRFRMGDTAGDGYPDDKPVHSVTVRSFYLGKYEVTQKEWAAVMASNPSSFRGGDRPVERVRWFDAVEFCNRLSAKEGLEPCYTISGTTVSCDFDRTGYRLPTEAEWEYAAKGGRSSRGYTYAGGNDANAVGWYHGNSSDASHPVGGKQANELGLHDMSGNVCEWCWDWYGRYSAGAQTDPRGPSLGRERVARGGWWDSREYTELRASSRSWSHPGNVSYHLGFRLARSAGPGSKAQSAVRTPPAVAEAPDGFVLVEGGTFQMGDTTGGGEDDEKPPHSVTVSSFYLGTYEVTQKEWDSVMGWNPSYFKGESFPVESVSWFDAVQFCNGLSAKEGLQPCYVSDEGTPLACDFDRTGYRLPTEAEWEYAAKGGRSSQGHTFAGGRDAGAVAWYDRNSGKSTHRVGAKQPNELGLYDMSGNVWEWCWDWAGSYSAGAQTDPAGPTRGTDRVLRGGSWDLGDTYLRCAYRYYFRPDEGSSNFGFRLVRRAD